MAQQVLARAPSYGGYEPSDATHGGTIDKVSRYGWTFKDSPGEQKYLDKALLEVDRSYQRNANDKKVLRIAREWSWIACNSICVASRDGKYFVIDGQHRVMAAQRRSDVKTLPCLVFETIDSVQEAKGFLDANVNRKPMTMQERYNALLKAEDDTALKADKYIRQTGRSIDRHGDGNSFTAIKTLMCCIEQDEEALSEIWPLMTEICEGRAFHNELLQGAFYLQCRAKEGCSLSARPWREKMRKIGYNGLIDAIYRAKAFYTKGGARIYAEGLAQALNHGMKKRKFEVNWPS